jgi:hypothetical protein
MEQRKKESNYYAFFTWIYLIIILIRHVIITEHTPISEQQIRGYTRIVLLAASALWAHRL